MVDECREQIPKLNDELRTVSGILREIRRAENRESSLCTKRAYKFLRAYQEGVPEEDITVPKPENPEELRTEHYHSLRNDLTEAKPELEKRQTELRALTIERLSELVNKLCVEDGTKRDQIIALKETLQSDFRGDLVAEAIDCSSGYPGKFRWDDEQEQVVIREGVKARRRNRFSDSQKEKIKQRANQACVKCGSESQLQVHHIVPVDQGGGNGGDNGATLCKSCHDFLHRWGNGYDEDYDSVSEFWSWIA